MFAFPLPYQFRQLDSHSISPGNPSGAHGYVKPGHCAHYLTTAEASKTVTLADIEGPGMVRHIWLTFPERTPKTLRSYVLRMYWDESEYPSVEAPVGDFFGLAHGRTGHFSTPYLGVSEGKGFNCFFPMPFQSRCRITFENDSPLPVEKLFYQISYTFGDEIGDDFGRFHAHFRRTCPPLGANHVVLDTHGSPGVYVGTVIGALPLTAGTWREGEFRFYIDNHDAASIVGTGWSDWFLSAWGIGLQPSLYAGSTYQVLHPDLQSKYFCSCHRFHVLDPIYFRDSLRVEHSQLGDPLTIEGWSNRADDWCSTAYWYQNLSAVPFPPLPQRAARLAGLEVLEWEAEAFRRMQLGSDRHDDLI